MKHVLLAASVAALIIAGCNKKSDDADSSGEGQVTSEAVETIVPNGDTAMAGEDGAMPAAPEMDADARLTEALRWMEANKARDGVITLPSGLQYTVRETGDEGGVSPTNGQKVRVNYEGRFVDGEVFDSSYERGEPAIFPSDRLIAGWVEALSLMKPGDVWTLYIPPELGYGEAGSVNPNTGEVLIPPNSALIFRLELIENL